MKEKRFLHTAQMSVFEFWEPAKILNIDNNTQCALLFLFNIARYKTISSNKISLWNSDHFYFLDYSD